MPVFDYQTIEKPAEGSYKEKGSKFLAFAYPVEHEEDIKEYMAALKKKYFDARHHCFAWMLGAESKRFRASDDGEPNHSAGDPILGQIRSKNVTDVLVVVVRYFGGVKLGVGGLISAYKSAAEDALNNAGIVRREVVERIILSYDYASTPDVMKLVKDFDLAIADQAFHDQCVMHCDVPLRMSAKLNELIQFLRDMKVLIDVTQGRE